LESGFRCVVILKNQRKYVTVGSFHNHII